MPAAYSVPMSDDRGGDTPYPEVVQQPDYPRLEERVLAFWDADGTFAASVAARAGGDNEYVFYDGPPFANGLPHYGHLLTGFVKDAVPRYQTMRGRRVERRFGWDCHGLPGRDGGREGARVLGSGRHHRLRDRPVQRLLPRPGPAHHRLLGALRSPARPVGSISPTTTRPWTSPTWRASRGPSSVCGRRGSSTRARRSSPTAGSARPRCRISRPGPTTPTDPGWIRP